MIFHSTRDPAVTAGYREAVLRGLAPDGGLFHPSQTPDLRDLFLSLGAGSTFVETATAVVHQLLGDVFDEQTARAVCESAFSFSPKLVTLRDRVHLLELFHGPSCAFKDFGASFLASSMEHLLSDSGESAVILTATSGDTGSAVAQAFHRKPNISVVILYPSGRVSHLQEQQLTTVGDNVTALEVRGSFDDCQRMVKEAFVDTELRSRVPLTSANSINLGRLLPQAFYYIHAFQQLRESLSSDFYFGVPSGNFGNLTAGVLAWSWGLPVDGFVAATNANDVVPEYLKTGDYRPRPSIRTIANAMDVGRPSNFERLLAIFESDQSRFASMLTGTVATDDQIRRTMKSVYDENGILIDPHTAAGVFGVEQFLEMDGAGDADIVTLATAHPAKFRETVRESCGVEPELPQALETAMHKVKSSVVVDPRLDSLRRYLLEHYDTHH